MPDFLPNWVSLVLLLLPASDSLSHELANSHSRYVSMNSFHFDNLLFLYLVLNPLSLHRWVSSANLVIVPGRRAAACFSAFLVASRKVYSFLRTFFSRSFSVIHSSSSILLQREM